MQENIRELEQKFEQITSELNNISGKFSLLKEQKQKTISKIESYKKQKIINEKCIEILRLVQENSVLKIKKGFENIVTDAIQYIKGKGFGLQLEFTKRGNLQELNFTLYSPDCHTAFDPKDKDAGGVLDILSLALRVVVLELYKPKIEGFLVLDEPFRNLSIKYLENARTFLGILYKKFNRQIILVTHKKELINSDFNIIKLMDNKCSNCKFWKQDFGVFCDDGWSGVGKNEGYCYYDKSKPVYKKGEDFCHNFISKEDNNKY